MDVNSMKVVGGGMPLPIPIPSFLFDQVKTDVAGLTRLNLSTKPMTLNGLMSSVKTETTEPAGFQWNSIKVEPPPNPAVTTTAIYSSFEQEEKPEPVQRYQAVEDPSKILMEPRSLRNNIHVDCAVINGGFSGGSCLLKSPFACKTPSLKICQESSLCVNPKWKLKIQREKRTSNEQKRNNVQLGNEIFNGEIISSIKVEIGEIDSPREWESLKPLDELTATAPNESESSCKVNPCSFGMKRGNLRNDMALVDILSSNIKVEMGSDEETPDHVFSLPSKNHVSKQTISEQLAILKDGIDISDSTTLSYWDGFKNHTCLVCGYKTHIPSNMVKHLRTHTGEKPYVCTECDYRCVESSGLRSHMRTHTGEKPHSCPYCDFQTRQSMSLKNHIMTHLGQKPLKCSMCDYRCIERSSLKVHLRTHSGEKPYACPHCNYRGIKSSSLKSHMRVHTGDKPYQCSYCGFTCSCASSLKLHLRKHTGEKPYGCRYCDFRSSSSSQLKVHTRRHTGEKPYLCKECGYRSSTNGRYVAHLRIHTGEKNHVCPYCDYRSTRSDNLKVHLRTHTGERPYPCPHCEYRSTEKARLVAHIRVHTGEKPFVCKVCGFSSADATGLRSHMKTHSSAKPHCCPHCSFQTARGGVLKSHIMRHTGIKPYACPFCPYKSKKSCTLKIHVANHTGNKRFKCPEPGCEFRACVPSGLRGHIGTHLKEKRFKCDLCPYKGKQIFNLKAHLRHSHSNKNSTPPYSCYCCDFNTYLRQDMKLHAAEHLVK